MSIRTTTKALLDEFRSRPTMRAGSLIITMFGDAIAPRGGVVWIGSLIRVLSEFGVSERLVRTSVFRLSKDDWLDVNPVGRRSYYRLTKGGVRRFEQATHSDQDPRGPPSAAPVRNEPGARARRQSQVRHFRLRLPLERQA